MKYFLSYPRSGVTWLRYCVEFLTKRPTRGNANDHPIATRGGIDFDVNFEEEIVAYKRHWWNGDEYDSDDHIILIIRDYKEVLARNYTKDDHSFKKVLTKNLSDYINNIKNVHDFDGGKTVLYYEDLIKDDGLKKSLEKLLNVFEDATQSRLDSLMSNIEYHRKCSIKSYPQSYTKGKTEVHHQNEITEVEREKISNRVQEVMRNEIFNKYLGRYKI